MDNGVGGRINTVFLKAFLQDLLDSVYRNHDLCEQNIMISLGTEYVFV
jgi:hypothetical protein